MTTGHRNAWMHSLSGFEASQIPAAIMGMEQRKAMKFRTAVTLLLTPMVEIERVEWYRRFVVVSLSGVKVCELVKCNLLRMKVCLGVI